jgi:hypothetical protein
MKCLFQNKIDQKLIKLFTLWFLSLWITKQLISLLFDSKNMSQESCQTINIINLYYNTLFMHIECERK